MRAVWKRSSGQRRNPVRRNPNLKFSKVDVRSRSEVRNWIQDIVHDFKLDGICSNAGITPIEGPSGATDDELYDKIFDICTKGVWNCGTEAFFQFKKQGDGGVIVNMASAAGLKVVKCHPVYVGAKHAVVGFTKTWAAMWGFQYICVNAIAPGTSIHSNCASFVSSYWSELTLRRIGRAFEVFNT